ncbi:hypothetical protein M422DRAFT_245197 [Sphaerobolus stellatus SS14]|nr:hypothetical protein M422DRAFT_245197 [Sphaerobolus stellatus SS14]
MFSLKSQSKGIAPVPFQSALLTLTLSTRSFLEIIMTDNGIPIYSTETNVKITSLSRWSTQASPIQVAHIRWPEKETSKGKSKEPVGAMVFMDGMVRSEEDLLKHSRWNETRRFRIQGHTDTLKWKRAQDDFHCITPSGPVIATLEPVTLAKVPQINFLVFTLSGLPQPQDRVTWLLVDYLIVTAMLLLTSTYDLEVNLPDPDFSMPQLSPFMLPEPRPSPQSSALDLLPTSHFLSHCIPNSISGQSNTTLSSSSPGVDSPRSPGLWTDSMTSSNTSITTGSGSSGVQWQSSPSQIQSHSHPLMAQAHDQYIHGQEIDQDDALPTAESGTVADELPRYEDIQWTVRVRQPNPRGG